MLIQDIQHYQSEWASSEYGLISAIIGVHGTVSNDEKIHFVPAYQWENKSLKEDLENVLEIDISIQNNANLSAYAERVYAYHDSDNLLCIMLSSGIGVGLMVDGNLQTGFHGFSGEMGHMIIKQNGELCNCGNRGCWELYSSEKSLFIKLMKHMQVDYLTYDELEQLIEQKDSDTMAILEEYIVDLSTGLNNIINLYNPETVVLTSRVLKMYPNAIEKIKRNFHSTMSQYGSLVLSGLGYKSCSLGACALGIQRFLEVSEVVLTLDAPLVATSHKKDGFAIH